MEIERRWLLAGFPETLCPAGAPPFLYESVQLQCYLCTAPAVRLRAEETTAGDGPAPTHMLCIKGRGMLARTEVELPLGEADFLALQGLVGPPPIHKRNRRYRLADGHLLECSLVDEGTPTAFFYAEVEFASLQEAAAFVPPAFLGQEKTDDATFSMSNYWKRKCAAEEKTP